jgi:D-beta-D-heptose 7-phosphate kinase/D-beta-D-heptose 1-phosphate adenosyltransferase
MTDIDLKKMKKTIQNIGKKRILVMGDLMMDKYIWGNVTRISPEAPVPVVEVRKDTCSLGGAGNVSHNLRSLGASPLLVGVVGEDNEGEWIRENAGENQGIFVDKTRPTIVKTRIIAHQQQVVRVDLEKKSPLSPKMEKKIVDLIHDESYEGILLSDYNKGTLTRSLMNKILPYIQRKKIPVFVDPKIENFFLFSPVTLITPNHHEAERIVHHVCLSDTEIEKAGEKILSRISSRYLILKRGEQGMTVFERGKKAYHIPTTAREVYDVTGAGDTVIAVASLALLSGASIQEAAQLSNTAAGIVVGKLGTAALTPKELMEGIRIL